VKLSQVISETKIIFNSYWNNQTPVFYENEQFKPTGNESFIYYRVMEADKNQVGIYGNSAKKGLKRSNGFIYIDYFFKMGLPAEVVNQTVEGIISAMTNAQLSSGEIYEGVSSQIQRSGNKAFNFIRITIELDYEDIE